MRPLVLDVTNQDQVDQAASAVASSGVPLHTVINNAGISAFGFCELLPIERYQQNANVNYIGPIRITKAFLPLLRKTKGRLINMGSMSDRMPSAFGSSYVSTKAALAFFSDCVRQEVHRFGVKVVLIEPGFFASNLLANGSANGAADSNQTEELKAAYGDYKKKMKAASDPIEMLEKLNGGAAGLATVADQVVDAAANIFPKYKYVVGWDANLVLRWLPYVPEWIIDNAQTLQDM
jgi:retinol dehydrogenase-16